MMKKIKGKVYEGERALFKSKGLNIIDCVFQNGESPLKESKKLKISKTTFSWKYPLWYCNKITVNDSLFDITAKSGIWYTKNAIFNNCQIRAPKEFRRSFNITLNNCTFSEASETLWHCDKVKINNVKAIGDYLLMNSSNITIDTLELEGNYFADGAKNLVIKNSILNSKDAFWNCENVTVINSSITGEYFGWNSKNVTLIDCSVESHQGFCYMKNVKLVNCSLRNTTLAFEYSTVNAKINTRISSVKNPISGRIVSKGIDELIKDDCNIKRTKIVVKE